MRIARLSGWVVVSVTLASVFATSRLLTAQNAPIAIVPVEGVTLTGGLNVADGKAMIGASGTVMAGDHAATITLPQRGNLRICPTTKVSLTADSSVAPTATSGAVSGADGGAVAGPVADGRALMMALARGAVEANFATGKNSDVILTPDFRIVISGPGTAHVQVRLGDKGDTCVDNHGADAPYVTVSSIFEGGVYRVQSDQRVMFQHGSLREVVDREKESCGCPPEQPKSVAGNEFPVAQSAGLAPLATPPPNATTPGVVAGQATVQLSYDGANPGAIKAKVEAPTPVPAPAPPAAAKPEQKPGFFSRIGHFFKKVFGG